MTTGTSPPPEHGSPQHNMADTNPWAASSYSPSTVATDFGLDTDDDEADFDDLDLGPPESKTEDDGRDKQPAPSLAPFSSSLPPPPASASILESAPPPPVAAETPVPESKRPTHLPSSTTTAAVRDFDLSLKSPDGFGSFAVSEADGGLVLAVLLVNFHHLQGPIVEFSYPPDILSSSNLDPEIPRLLPFLALPDGAHLSDEDYSYFHLVNNGNPSSEGDENEKEPFPPKQTIFGISCNRQLASSELLNRPTDVTRSTVQMAVVVLARQPVFGPIRDKLGVVTRAFFAQRDFESTEILTDFYHSLRAGMKGTVSETTMHMGTSIRELIHQFRHKTLVLLKLLLLQKKIMWFGYPVERLCTMQYSLVSLVPGLLMSLSDAGSPILDIRSEQPRTPPTSLKTSDRASLLHFFGFPLDLFGKEAFFQPYLPLQQIDLCTTQSWLIGTTNQIMLQQRDAAHDCLVNIEHTTLEFSDPKLERLVALTPADRRWMDEIVRTVEETWNPEDPTRPKGMVFTGSDDFLRAKFEEYLCSVLSSMKYADFLAKAAKADVAMVGGNFGTSNPQVHFSLPWIKELRATNAFQAWNKTTDPVLFDIWEPKHPYDGKADALSDIGLRLAEGFHDLNINENLAPTREALSSAFATGSTSLFRAFEGVRSGLSQQLAAIPSSPSNPTGLTSSSSSAAPAFDASATTTTITASRAPSPSIPNANPSLTPAPGLAPASETFGRISAGIGSFWGRASARVQQAAAATQAAKVPSQSRYIHEDDEEAEIVIVDLDAKRRAEEEAKRIPTRRTSGSGSLRRGRSSVGGGGNVGGGVSIAGGFGGL